jgi:hypothetical protein
VRVVRATVLLLSRTIIANFTFLVLAHEPTALSPALDERSPTGCLAGMALVVK